MIRFIIGFLVVFGAVGNDQAPLLQVLGLATVGIIIMAFGVRRLIEQEQI